MNFSGWLARFRRLQDEHATWKLLHADNAPVILAFIADLFAEENEVPFAWARIALDAELELGRELGYWQSESGAGIYLNQWIRAGLLREMDDMLSKTDNRSDLLTQYRITAALGGYLGHPPRSCINRSISGISRSICASVQPSSRRRWMNSSRVS